MTTRTPEQLRDNLVADIHRWGTFRTAQVEAAFRTVPRHLFLPDVDLETAYAPQVVVTRRAPDGTALSSASQPSLIAAMLEQADVQPGHRVLEIGTATGINAALLAELTGPTGQVTTIEIDEELAAGARTALTTAGYERVDVVHGDGAAGHLGGASYDRIVITAGAWDLAKGWWDQLAPAGRIIVPLRLHGSGLARSLPLDAVGPGRLVSRSALVCGFVPLRGTNAHTGHALTLADGVASARRRPRPRRRDRAARRGGQPTPQPVDRVDDPRRRTDRAPRPVARHRRRPVRPPRRRHHRPP
ncbi:rRNA adenine N-6-methyltransferase family protein [Frankia sp. CcWB2]